MKVLLQALRLTQGNKTKLKKSHCIVLFPYYYFALNYPN